MTKEKYSAVVNKTRKKELVVKTEKEEQAADIEATENNSSVIKEI